MYSSRNTTHGDKSHFGDVDDSPESDNDNNIANNNNGHDDNQSERISIQKDNVQQSRLPGRSRSKSNRKKSPKRKYSKSKEKGDQVDEEEMAKHEEEEGEQQLRNANKQASNRRRMKAGMKGDKNGKHNERQRPNINAAGDEDNEDGDGQEGNEEEEDEGRDDRRRGHSQWPTGDEGQEDWNGIVDEIGDGDNNGKEAKVSINANLGVSGVRDNHDCRLNTTANMFQFNCTIKCEYPLSVPSPKDALKESSVLVTHSLTPSKVFSSFGRALFFLHFSYSPLKGSVHYSHSFGLNV